jgi:Cu/Ag efflux pump CusA
LWSLNGPVDDWFHRPVGIATRNGIMLVSYIQHLMQAEGLAELREAVERGSHHRGIG